MLGEALMYSSMLLSSSAEGFYAVRKLGMGKDRDYGVSLDSARN